MWTIRSLGGVALFLAGSTWLWLTPAFAGRDVSTTGSWWSITRVLCLLTMAGFIVATLGLFSRQGWWESAALGSAGLGLVSLIPFWIAAERGGQSTGTTAWNVFIHVVMVAGIFALLLIPEWERWVERHVMSG